VKVNNPRNRTKGTRIKRINDLHSNQKIETKNKSPKNRNNIKERMGKKMNNKRREKTRELKIKRSILLRLPSMKPRKKKSFLNLLPMKSTLKTRTLVTSLRPSQIKSKLRQENQRRSKPRFKHLNIKKY